ncbi:MAG: hypothetical protein A3B99_03250 [Candidatus Yanofskybacteria bacterium RIFCSPHIGHO2_02_FULL_44_12b]|uniref:DUF192 domain-containing protein n=2 Tax=Candidatus Yanofskyibacteriota TaxID=1752733 RepID=A0A1F8GLE1_9BACT|nr:MAG: hypothetical protein UW79_C0004G0040 [Candidatus Yanofskybacteria bacterium GW2011_GWA2_44_9]OGN05322.1 MAG: hypothetical protein A2659_01820 [Candidatus Yanofskybacteria bacterium RIFCSPHIGHO2_01_FULL_44_24]OGN16303.1 MAG: hypothetical protein A3B99_03250 [Candidatus Yanofskybacteria bacterium RIFCSPHIGHO2_02_FULL_44_12b]OGN25538.1 MAG: hypothetical protein A2925_02325 [Candidatus Yanofskybacteria bacterium RIFCSPLOWO2_01_FULL_44_22]
MTVKKISLIAAAIVLLFFVLKSSDTDQANEQKITIGRAGLRVETADTASERQKGLSGRNSLGDEWGMLFIFPYPQTPGFWMKDMKFPLDIIWIGPDKSVMDIARNISSETFPAIFRPPGPVLYVLEVNAGWAAKNNISPGDKMEL